MAQQKEDVTFSPGTVVLQYINDDERCVGVVVDEKLLDRLSDENRKKFEMHREKNDQHILLILGHFKDYDDRWSAFAHGKAFQFPTYVVMEKRTATKADFSAHIDLMFLHDTEEVSRGLTSGRMRARMFSFSKKQEEVLNLVLLLAHYKSGGSEENVPDRLRFSGMVEVVMNELSIALPLSKK